MRSICSRCLLAVSLLFTPEVFAQTESVEAQMAVDSSGGKDAKVTLLPPGIEAPTFSMADLSGDRVSLRTWTGSPLNKPFVNKIRHVVVLSFWATYCQPCQKEIPELMEFAKKHEGQPIKIFLVSIDKEGASKVGPFVAEKKYTLPVLLDPYTSTARRYGATKLPSLIVIDSNGIIRYSSVGYDAKVSLVDKLDSIINPMFSNLSADKGRSLGLRVPEKTSEAPLAIASGIPISAKQKWDAVIRVESGQKIETVAADMKVSPAVIREWYDQLKKAAIEIWGQHQ